MLTLGGMSADNTNGNVPMSKLEQLARRRAQQRSNTQQNVAISSSSSQTETKKVSLKERLAALKQNKTENDGSTSTTTKSSALLETLKNKKNDNSNNKSTRMSLTDRLQKTKVGNVIKQSELTSSNSSLSTKLDLIRNKQKQNESSKSPVPSEMPSSENNEEPAKSPTPISHVLVNVNLDWKKFTQLKQQFTPTDTMTGIETDESSKSDFINFVNKPTPDHKFGQLLKRRREDIFAIYQPSQTVKKQRIIEKFSEPSPDDIIIEAQAKVFDEVTTNVADLNIAGNNKKAEEELQLPSKPRILLDVSKYLSTKPGQLNISVLGHKHSGKSTMMGRILMDLKQINIEDIRKLKNICERAKIENPNTYLTWISDTSDSERSNGYSEEIHKHNITSADCDKFSFYVNPSEQNKISELICQVSNTDVVVMVIDCSPDGFEQGFNLNGQTIEHSVIAKLCAVKHFIVVMNKMDTIDWYKGRYSEIVNELQMFYDKLGFKSDSISWIPVSSVTGEGLVTEHTSIDWYNGPSLLDMLNQKMQFVNKKKQKFYNDEFFSLSIQAIRPESNEITGWITNGYIQAGESITVYPLSKTYFVDEVNNDSDGKQIGIPGFFVTLKLLPSLSKLEKNLLDNIEVGDFATSIIAPVIVVNSKTIKLEVPVSLMKLTVGMKLNIIRQMYTNAVKILKLHKGSKKNKFMVIECKLIREDTLPYFPQGNQKENYIVLRAPGTNKTIGLGKLME